MIVTVQICPDGRIRVQKSSSVNVAQFRAAAFDNHNWLALQPIAHLRERMPDELAVELGEFVHFKSVNAASNSETSSAVCAAVNVTRKRALPRATVG